MTATRRRAKLYRGTPRNIAFLAGRLRAGELVGVPTETVYGLAANALDPTACARIFRAKGRPTTDPLIVHIYSVEQFHTVGQPNAAALKLAETYWPGPLTLVVPKREVIPGIVTAGRASVAVRMPAHPLFRKLLKATGLPLAAPSANPFGYISPTTAAHVRDSLGAHVLHVLDGGPCRIGLESTIVDVRDESRPVLLRAGAVTAEQLERTLGTKVVTPTGVRRGPQIAPGQLARHYSPRTPVVLHETMPGQRHWKPDEAFVFLRQPSRATSRNVFWLDPKGNLDGVAQRLFAVLRELDAKKFTQINIELAPDRGIGRAINDRLRRAAAR